MNQSRTQLIQELFDTMSAFKRSTQGRAHMLAGTNSISHAQAELLMAIQHRQPISSKELADLLNLTPGAVSQLVEPLEKGGYVERKTSDQDRRVQYLNTSKVGIKLLQDFDKRRRAMIEAVIADLSDEELAVWVRIQKKISENVKAKIQAEKENQ